MAPRLGQLGTLSLLCAHRMLVDRSFQPLLRTSGHNLHHLCLLCPRLFLAGLHQHLVAHVHRSFRTRVWDWSQIRHGAHLRRRNCTQSHPRCPRHAMANVDRVRHYVGLCSRYRIVPGRRHAWGDWSQLAAYDGICDVARRRRHLPRLPRSGISSMVYEQREALQGLRVHVQVTA